MSGIKVEGKISQKLNYEIEWTTEAILSRTTVDEYYYSPTFSVPGSNWYFLICPIGVAEQDSIGWIGLYLGRRCDDSAPPKSVNFDFGLKRADGTVDVINSDVSHVFDKKSPGWGFPKFLQRSKLLERRWELLTSGCLTVTCTMRMKDVLDYTSRLIEVTNDFKKLFVSKKDCDATLKVQDKELPAHKFVLATRSVVFDAMFQTDMKEKITGVVHIDDCHPEAFEHFLKYIYNGQFENSGDLVELYKIAHKYCVESLKSDCVQFMMDNLSVDNVLNVSLLANLFDEAELKAKSQEFINEHFADVVLTDKWGSFLNDNPKFANEMIINMAKGTKNKRSEKKWSAFDRFGMPYEFFC